MKLFFKATVNKYLLLIIGIVSWSTWYVDYSGVDPDIGVARFGLLLCVSTVVYAAAPLLLVVRSHLFIRYKKIKHSVSAKC